MSRKLRIQYPGAIYHVVNRGDQREAIFQDQYRQKMLVAAGRIGPNHYGSLRQETGVQKAERIVLRFCQ